MHPLLQRPDKQELEDEDVGLAAGGVGDAHAQRGEVTTQHGLPVVVEGEPAPHAKRLKQDDNFVQLLQHIFTLAPVAQAPAIEAWKVNARTEQPNTCMCVGNLPFVLNKSDKAVNFSHKLLLSKLSFAVPAPAAPV